VRVIAPAAIGIVALAAAVVQIASMALYGDLAHAPAVPALLPPELGIRLARPLGSPAAPPLLRALYAQALLHRGATSAAAAIVAALPDGADAADLRGQLAESAGNAPEALGWFARARDVERAQRLIDADDAAGHAAHAAVLEAQLVAVLGADADTGVRARALWRLGQLTAEQAQAAGAAGDPLARRALAWYERALQLAPNDETFLLAAGGQSLAVGDAASAERFFRRALEAVPNSAEAREGLARARP
jgi:tetratricopeptide (TPR) repeat protein